MSKPPQPVITLLTDFGTEDYYVGALKGTLLRLAPQALLIDITHQVSPGDIEEGAFLLGASHRHFPPGTIHLAVIDPGVGGHRRILAARGENAHFVAPDNGLLSYLLDGAEVRQVEAAEVFIDAPGETFHGRDRFAPVAAYLARGEPFEALGSPMKNPLQLDHEPPKRREGSLEGRIVHIDRFGNLVTDIPSRWFPDDRVPEFECRLPGLEIRRWATHYAELAPGEAALIPGSLGTLEVSLNQESAAAKSGITRKQTLRISFR
ncbi:MAG: SAM-dependent chlorinase/fluorinase [bacterium]|nr:SAM-dependent chlorinase/fluorinase [bacterium]